MTWNLYTCTRCNRKIISEERKTHRCVPLKEYIFEKDILWINDGVRWYPLSMEKIRQNKIKKKYSNIRSEAKNNRKFTDDDSNRDADITISYK